MSLARLLVTEHYPRTRRDRARWRLYQLLIGWELFRPDLNGLPGGLLATSYRVKPIGWRRLLSGRRDASRL